MGEITVILLLALIFLGPGKLPDLASSLGKIIREIRKATSDVKNEITLDDSFRKPFEELRDAVTLHPEELKRRDMLQKAIAEAAAREAEAAKAAAEAGTTPSELAPPDGLASPVKTLGVSIPDAETLGAPAAPSLPPPVTPNETIVQAAPPRGATLDDVPTPEPAAKPASSPLFPPAGAIARGSRPTPAPTTETSNVTQILKEEDLMPAKTGGPPPPPHLPGLVRPPTPPPGVASVPSPDKKKT